MEEWTVIHTLKAAHQVGLSMMDSLAQAAVDLKEGRRYEALAGFENILRFFDGDLKLHFDHEERALFPVMRRIIGPAGPIGAMVGEHDSLWRCVDEFIEEVEILRDDVDGVDAQCIGELNRLANHIVWLLRGHIEREDTMLFPLAESILDEQGRREVSLNFEMVQQLAQESAPRA